MRLSEKVSIITGGSNGMGAEEARLFATQGSTVVVADLQETEGMEVVKEIESSGGKAIFEKLDVTEEGQWVSLIERVTNNFGGLHILVNNAGITKDNLLMRMSEEDFDKVIEVNLKSIFNMTKAVQRTMLKQRKGSIINMSSVVGVTGNAGQANYAASKSGIIGFSKSMAQELGSRNIRTNVIAPGFIETEMTEKLDEKVVDGWRQAIPLKRGGSPEDIANACVFLGSELSSYITGQVLHVDGGMHT